MPRDTQACALASETLIYKQNFCYPHVADTGDKTPSEMLVV